MSETTKTAEEFVDRRMRNGTVQYLVRWNNCSSEYYTWEDEKNLLDGLDMIIQFEDKLRERKKKPVIEKEPVIKKEPVIEKEPVIKKEPVIEKEQDESSDYSFDAMVKSYKLRQQLTAKTVSSSEDGRDEKKSKEFDTGFQPKQILDAFVIDGQRMFLMEWKNTAETSLVPADQANNRCLQLVVQFYEDRFPWHIKESAE